MTILEKIIRHKRLEVEAKKAVLPVSLLEKSGHFNRETVSLTTAIKNSNSGIIAEHKRRSPSKSVINDKLNIHDVAKAYESAGACGLSILTDTTFFGGSLEDLLVARAAVSLPILRKEFIIDPYQIYEAKAFGADAILLIASCLCKSQLEEFSTLAKSLNLDVLLEIHNHEELEISIHTKADMIGINNRNLKTFEVSLENSKALSNLIPPHFIKVSESGLHAPENIDDLKNFGFQGFLIGEHFMKTKHPGTAASEFISKIDEKL